MDTNLVMKRAACLLAKYTVHVQMTLPPDSVIVDPANRDGIMVKSNGCIERAEIIHNASYLLFVEASVCLSGVATITDVHHRHMQLE
jgi:hypothetical protein